MAKREGKDRVQWEWRRRGEVHACIPLLLSPLDFVCSLSIYLYGLLGWDGMGWDTKGMHFGHRTGSMGGPMLGPGGTTSTILSFVFLISAFLLIACQGKDKVKKGFGYWVRVRVRVTGRKVPLSQVLSP